MKRICVFCGSNIGRNPSYRAEAEKLGRLLARRDVELVYGGGNIGLMGAVADACLAANGTVIGVIPQALVGKEVAGCAVDHRALTRMEIVDSMHTRKARMAELSDGFIALPGGFGTFEEFCEVLTWGQLGFHVKPMGLLNVAGFLRSAARPFRPCRRSGLPACGKPRHGARRNRYRASARRHGRLPARAGQQMAEGIATALTARQHDVLKSQLNPRSVDFQANAAAMATVVADLHEKVEKIALGGPEAARQKPSGPRQVAAT